MKSLQKNGFINYYGLQRFSTSVIPTHSVGLALLKGNWKLAVSLIMRPRPDEPPEANVGRRAWEEKQDAITAMSKIEKRNVAEHQLLRYFKAHGPQNHYNALCEIPRNLRTMYTHAYQSVSLDTQVNCQVLSSDSISGTESLLSGSRSLVLTSLSSAIS